MPAMHTTAPTSISAEELLFLGSRCRILVTSESTAGKYGLVDMIEVAADDMPPLHVHHTHDEGFLLLDGELSLFLPDHEITLRPGEFVLAPRGVPHTYHVGGSP
jgi:mannose-6-phosphate isomerase-like protein (cupin superfamily)